MNEITRSPNFVFLVLRAGNFSKEAERETLCARALIIVRKSGLVGHVVLPGDAVGRLSLCVFFSANSLS
jgi:hypothetical protein